MVYFMALRDNLIKFHFFHCALINPTRALQNAGRSDGVRDVTKFPSTTTWQNQLDQRVSAIPNPTNLLVDVIGTGIGDVVFNRNKAGGGASA